MAKYIFLAIYIILAISVIFVERKSPTEAIMWVLILLCLPYVGIFLYLIFGTTFSLKMTTHFRNKRLKKKLDIVPQPSVPQPEGLITENEKRVIKFNEVYNRSRLTCFDDAVFLTSGKAHYEHLFRDIKNAKEYIFVEFYTIHNDIIGHEFVRALTEKANENVTVLVMCDFMANIGTPHSMFRPLIKAGGKVIRIKPYLTHFRSHRKIVVIDRNIAYIGGMNIGKQYANMHKKKTPWRDTQIRLEGACTGVLNECFLRDWLLSARLKEWNYTVSCIEKMKPDAYPLTNDVCQFIMGGADNDKESVKMCYLSMIRSAKKQIRIQSPYFIPDATILDALKIASASGVEVEMIIPGIKASFFLDPVTNYYAGQLLQYGAKVHKYNGYIHAKTMLIDNRICCVGSVNMDIRSLSVDDEICGVFYSEELALRYRDIYNNDIEHSRPYTWEEFSNRSRFERFRESFFLPLAPLM